MKIKAVCEIKFHDILGENDFSELLKHMSKKIKINGKDYYLSTFKRDYISFVELNRSEHEIEIGGSMFNTSTADVVEVVRCKDCKHRNPYCYKCMRDNLWHGSDDFCSYGERKENEQ